MPSSNRSSEHSTFASQAICGVSTSFLIFAIGVACLVISALGFFDENVIECGEGGKPPLIIWVLGTGVAFFIISCSFYRVSSGKGGNMAKWILGVTNLFVVVWAIVGIFSMFWYDGDCRDSSPALWRMAWAAVIASFLVCCCGGFVGYNVRTAEAEVVNERTEEQP